MKRLLLLIALFSCAFGRDDPFTSVIEPKDSIRPYYGETSVFNSAQIELPSNARLIKRVEITYQNIDGSIESKSVPLSGRIDSRMPLILSQEYKGAKSTPKASVQTTYGRATQKAPAKTNAYEINGNSIFIAQNSELLRDFMLGNPHRIVLDFAPTSNFRNKIITLNVPHFSALKYGLHDNFVRIVIELDGSHIYNISKNADGVIVNVE